MPCRFLLKYRSEMILKRQMGIDLVLVRRDILSQFELIHNSLTDRRISSTIFAWASKLDRTARRSENTASMEARDPSRRDDVVAMPSSDRK